MGQQDLSQSFQRIENDQTALLVEFLAEGNQIPSVQECLKEQLNWLDIQPGQHILDIGCGIGYQAFELAKKVGSSGKVEGTDLSEIMIEVSKQRHSTSGLPLTFQQAEATDQPFSDESFDCVRTERVLMFVADSDKAFQEFHRLLKPGGKLLVFDFDWDSLSIYHTNKALTRRIVTFISDSYPNGRSGAKLLGYFKRFGFKNIKIKAFGYMPSLAFAKRAYGGVIATDVEKSLLHEAEIHDWWAYLEQEDLKESFFNSINGFLVMGVK